MAVCKNVLNYLNKKIGTHSACRLLTSTIRQGCGIKAAGTLTQAVKWLGECGFVSWTRTGRSSAYQINRENIRRAIRLADIEAVSGESTAPKTVTQSHSEPTLSDIQNVTESHSECHSARFLHTTSSSISTTVPTWERAAAELRSCGIDRVFPFVDEAKRLGKTPEDVIEATKTFLANRSKLESPGALFRWLREGCWPAAGIRDPETIKTERERNHERQQQLAKQAEIERGPSPEWDEELVRIDAEGGSKAVMQALERRRTQPKEHLT